MVMAAISAPAAAGVKCPWITQFAPAAKLDAQEFVNANEEAFSPVTLMLEIAKAAPPLLVIVTCRVALAVPTACGPNARLAADSVTSGVSPNREMLCVA